LINTARYRILTADERVLKAYYAG